MQGRYCRWYGASSGVTAFRHWCVTDDGRCVSRPARMGTYACGEQPNFQHDRRLVLVGTVDEPRPVGGLMI